VTGVSKEGILLYVVTHIGELWHRRFPWDHLWNAKILKGVNFVD